MVKSTKGNLNLAENQAPTGEDEVISVISPATDEVDNAIIDGNPAEICDETPVGTEESKDNKFVAFFKN